MIAFPTMLMAAAEAAGMKFPDDIGNGNIEAIKDDYPHFYAFCLMQLGKAVPYHGCHWDNAKVIASFSEGDILNKTPADLIEAGFAVVF